ncbi:armadillo repeat-containing protein 6 homolog [Cephus cinctus]|uniref:Armadillo repeat-containing protein 6 homolog n=1 Tax=Cephus cinctus TaxID=211228 RepID=A0AAJ7R7M1_CEPCN|nr:armadillo repeat-containing protein 6 homolog [Cephus cinctus]
MVRVINQETYNEVVKENIEEFSMTPEEAIDDAIKQFEAQGVDLSNVIKDLILCDDRDLVKTCLDNLRSSIEEKNSEIVPEVLEKLKTELDKDIARRIHASNLGGYKILLDLIKEFKDDVTVVRPALRTMTSLMTGHPDLLDEAGVTLQMEILDKQHDVPTLQLLLRWMRECCIKHELNRQTIFNANALEKIKRILMREDATGQELRDACAVCRALVLDDDIRHEYGKAYEHATAIARDTLDVITSLLSRFKTDRAVVGDLMLTLASLIVRNEFCQSVEDAGGLKFILDVMVDHPDTEKLNWQALKLLKALAGNDYVKSHIVTSGGAPLIVSVISRFKGSETVVSSGLACISALTLRSPSNAGVFYDCGASTVIIDSIKTYPKSINVLKQACWAIRNMSVRNNMESQEFVQQGVEELLINAMKTHGLELENDVKAALRDLGLKVDLKERWVGKGIALSNDRN